MKKCSLFLMGGFGNQLFQVNHAMTMGFDFKDIALHVDSYRDDFYGRQCVLLSLYSFRVNRLSHSLVFLLKLARIFRGMYFSCIGSKSPADICLSNPFFSRVYLYGYFQRPKFISRDLLYALDSWLLRHSQLVYSDPLGSIDCAEKKSTIVFHCRGGDYINCSKASSVFCYLGPAYYSEALRILEALVPVEDVIIVTDDELHAECILGALEGDFRSHVVSSSLVDDMYLMTRAQNLVIANSTFSLWSAYLCSHHGGQVYCPSSWYLDPRLQGPSFCEDWTIVS